MISVETTVSMTKQNHLDMGETPYKQQLTPDIDEEKK